MNKTEAAFRLSVDKLMDESKRVYFWTFTFTEVWDDWVYSRQWARFWKKFTDCSNYFIGGLKVTELHPNGHGIHYHCLLNARLPVGEVRRIGKRYGIGRVHVVKANASACSYLAKYLSKKDSGLSANIRKWGTVGHFTGVKVRNIEVESEFVTVLKSVKGAHRMTYTGYEIARREYVSTGRISPSVVFNNLHRPKLAQFERMMANDILASLERDAALSEDQPELPVVRRYIAVQDRSIRRYNIFEVVGTSEYDEVRGRKVGHVNTLKQANLITDYLKEHLEKKGYNA